MASGQARGAAQRGKRVAFGDGRRIVWSPQSYVIFQNNPNVAVPGDEHRATDLEWIPNYRGVRPYGTSDGTRWHFRDFRPAPGEIYFSDAERSRIDSWRWPLRPIIVEPSVKPHGATAGVNKQWPVPNYLMVAGELQEEGLWVARVGPGGDTEYPQLLPRIPTSSFREAAMVMSQAQLFVGPEGGLHHLAAALGVPAVVIFGGFPSVKATGYPWHVNITVGAAPCGMQRVCPHCIEAMKSITVDRVLSAARNELLRGNVRKVM